MPTRSCFVVVEKKRRGGSQHIQFFTIGPKPQTYVGRMHVYILFIHGDDDVASAKIRVKAIDYVLFSGFVVTFFHVFFLRSAFFVALAVGISLPTHPPWNVILVVFLFHSNNKRNINMGKGGQRAAPIEDKVWRSPYNPLAKDAPKVRFVDDRERCRRK
jgi:hypothetical protein